MGASVVGRLHVRRVVRLDNKLASKELGHNFPLMGRLDHRDDFWILVDGRTVGPLAVE